MLLFRGLKPAIFLSITFLCTATAGAQQLLPLTLAEAEQLALSDEPGYAALRERAAALDEQSVAAGQLPDPTMRIGLANYPIQSGGFSTEGMTQAQLAYRQSFPSGKSRESGTERYKSLSLGMNASADAHARDVRARVRTAWLEAYYWEQAHTIVTESRPFFVDLATVTRSLYSVGKKTQHDVLRAELELSRLDDRLIDINRHNMQARAVLSEWLGEDASRPIAAALPEWQQIPLLEDLRSSLATHPSIIAADARITASDANVVVAEEGKKPGWALDLGYVLQQRPPGPFARGGTARTQRIEIREIRTGAAPVEPARCRVRTLAGPDSPPGAVRLADSRSVGKPGAGGAACLPE